MEILVQKGVIVRVKKANAILKRLVNKLFRIQHTYHDTNQTAEAAVIGKLKRICMLTA